MIHIVNQKILVILTDKEGGEELNELLGVLFNFKEKP